VLLPADAQTSGGLLAAGETPGAVVVGELVPRGEHVLLVRWVRRWGSSLGFVAGVRRWGSSLGFVAGVRSDFHGYPARTLRTARFP
jgi:hypothetical protein